MPGASPRRGHPAHDTALASSFDLSEWETAGPLAACPGQLVSIAVDAGDVGEKKLYIAASASNSANDNANPQNKEPQEKERAEQEETEAKEAEGGRPTFAHAPAFTASALESTSNGTHGNNAHPQHKEPEKERAAREEREAKEAEEWEFRPARVPDGLSLRNPGIQVPTYATLSDIVLYSPRGLSSPALRAHAAHFVAAVKRKRRERCLAMGVDPNSPDAPLEHNIFVLDADARALRASSRCVCLRAGSGGAWMLGCIVRMDVDGALPAHADTHGAQHGRLWAARAGRDAGAHASERDLVGFPPSVAGRAQGTSGGRGDCFWTTRGDVPLADGGAGARGGERRTRSRARDGLGCNVCVECHEMVPHLKMLDRMWEEHVRGEGGGEGGETQRAVEYGADDECVVARYRVLGALLAACSAAHAAAHFDQQRRHARERCAGRAEVVDVPCGGVACVVLHLAPPPPTPPRAPRTRSLTSPALSPPVRTRPLKVLIYSSDGPSLPEACLEPQVAQRRRFFVYPGELGLLRRVEPRIGGREVFAPAQLGRRMMSGAAMGSTGSLGSASGAQASASVAIVSEVAAAAPSPPPHSGGARPSAKSVSFAMAVPSSAAFFIFVHARRNHASNAYMLHALSITHVVSVSECALVPPPGRCPSTADSCTSAACPAHHNSNAHFIQGKGPGNQGSLWIEQREGRIKVLDIKGVQEGGQVLVHCWVGVSRSATITITYVMKHLALPLVDAYLIVRSRRLSVLLCGWEIKRAQGDEARLLKELARTLACQGGACPD
ncbi:hypothetical protein C8F04DRAFT_1299302 [Mycena alexandri]|uniref:Tyrosine specific protein phosphatases domain-containing protein n=1 Tax=Mycena alexandri TaxID=1745969 RepID=A0AAD6T9C1_9AGAR|nr:hypothetical protein C8F04DRAFT_1299302 [Mycena alexandri]